LTALPVCRTKWQNGQLGDNLQSYATRKGEAHLAHRCICADFARMSRAMTQASVMSAGRFLDAARALKDKFGADAAAIGHCPCA